MQGNIVAEAVYDLRERRACSNVYNKEIRICASLQFTYTLHIYNLCSVLHTSLLFLQPRNYSTFLLILTEKGHKNGNKQYN